MNINNKTVKEVMKKVFILLSFIVFYTITYAQKNDFGVWTTIGAEKDITKKVTLSADLELRTHNNAKSVDRWSGTLDLSYNLLSCLKVGGYYSYLHSLKDRSIKQTGEILSKYWYARHRFNFYVSGNYKIDKFTFSIREMWQYTYRPEKRVAYESNDMTINEMELIPGEGSNVLRSRLNIDYNAVKDFFTPYASVEIYNDKNGIDKTRYTLGSNINITENSEFGIFYRYQVFGEKGVPKDHIIGLEYKFNI